jgi:TonB family protein
MKVGRFLVLAAGVSAGLLWYAHRPAPEVQSTERLAPRGSDAAASATADVESLQPRAGRNPDAGNSKRFPFLVEPPYAAPRASGASSNSSTSQAAANGQPRLVSPVPATFPWQASAAGLEDGFVTVQFTVRADGAVENVVARESSFWAFEQPAVEAVERYIFEPATIDGRPVAVDKMLAKVEFSLFEQYPPVVKDVAVSDSAVVDCLGSAVDTQYWFMKGHRSDRACGHR